MTVTIDGANGITGNLTGNLIGTGASAIPSGTTAQRPVTPVDGMMRHNTTLNEFEVYQNGVWAQTSSSYEIQYLVIAGGGAGGNNHAGGGGAGGYRSSVFGESSGGGAIAEAGIKTFPGIAFSVVVGAGGTAAGQGTNNNTNGANSSFGTIVSIGGGAGGNRNDAASTSPGQSGAIGG